MIMLLALATLFFASAVIVYLYVRHQTTAAASQQESERRRRAVLDDFGDYAVWQTGQQAPTAITNKLPIEIVRTRRGFLARLASSFFVMIVGSSGSRAVVAQTSGKVLAWESGN